MQQIVGPQSTLSMIINLLKGSVWPDVCDQTDCELNSVSAKAFAQV